MTFDEWWETQRPGLPDMYRPAWDAGYAEGQRENEAELARLRTEAEEEYRVLECPKCYAQFADEGKDFLHGVMCPECTGGLRGVIFPRTVKRRITQEQWNALRTQVERLREENERHRRIVVQPTLDALYRERDNLRADLAAAQAALATAQGQLVAARAEVNMQIDAVNNMMDSCRSWMPLLGVGDELVRLTSPLAQHDQTDIQRVRKQWDAIRQPRTP